MSILEDFAARTPFPVRVFQNEQTKGVTQNFSYVLSECGGDLIALCDQDDVWLPNKLARIEEEFRHRRYGALFSNALLVDEDLHSTGERLWDRIGIGVWQLRRIRRGGILAMLVDRTFVTGATMVISAAIRDRALPIPQILPWPIIHDGWLALVAAVSGDVAAIPEALIHYRQHAGQQIGPDPRAKNVIRRYARWVATNKAGRTARETGYRRRMEQALERALALQKLLEERAGVPEHSLNDWRRGVEFLRRRQRRAKSRLEHIGRVTADALSGEYQRYTAKPMIAITRDLVYLG
jgi:hypothetical protein